MSERNPIELFRKVYAAAVATGMRDPNAMCLATIDPDGGPSTRMVLLKDFDEQGFVFYTNLESRKGLAIRSNPKVALTFYWRELQRQVQVRGVAQPVSDAEADAYFATRPRGSQLGAWASLQSRPLKSRMALLLEVAKIEARHLGRSIPRSPVWSGFRVVPHAIEFWKAGAFRLHDRRLFERVEGGWHETRLYP
ncbi:MAG: pyridoxamine 5'-phosphate oxidase [Phycisphaerae bacterium]|nr:pyridoxamine 5'-phosphate oxidase [Phycisphaerae bacterium]